MEKRFHGIDLHKRYATIIVRNSEGNETQHILRCADFKGYVEKLICEDVVERDAANLSPALRMAEMRHEFIMPTVYKHVSENA